MVLPTLARNVLPPSAVKNSSTLNKRILGIARQFFTVVKRFSNQELIFVCHT
jgi:hypothetical protein